MKHMYNESYSLMTAEKMGIYFQPPDLCREKKISLTNPRSFSVQDGPNLLFILRQGSVMFLPKSQLTCRSHCDTRLHIRRLIILYAPEGQHDERLDTRKIDCPMCYHTIDNSIRVII